jgi:hypothetical protein
MRDILAFIHQAPQELLGMIISRIWIKCGIEVYKPGSVVKLEKKHGIEVFVICNESRKKHRLLKHVTGTLSLGSRICMDDTAGMYDLLHAIGRTAQSKKFGWLYPLIVGIPSLFNNIYDRLFHADWTIPNRKYWLHSRWPELQADRIAGIEVKESGSWAYIKYD